jgi:acetyltransferase-like isoleucine patch superfamily enzyme
MEDDVFVAPMFASANTKRIVHGRDYPLVVLKSYIYRAARIGIGVLLMPGMTVGENAFVGPGSLVTKHIPPREIWYGHPAVKKGEVPLDEIL